MVELNVLAIRRALGLTDYPLRKNEKVGVGRAQIVLSEEQAAKIYSLRTFSLSLHPLVHEIAGKSALVAQVFSVSPKTVRDIWCRKTWSQATRPLWTEKEAVMHACQHMHSIIPVNRTSSTSSISPTCSATASNTPSVRSRGRPPGSKDSRPRKRKAEHDEHTHDESESSSCSCSDKESQSCGSSPLHSVVSHAAAKQKYAAGDSHDMHLPHLESQSQSMASHHGSLPIKNSPESMPVENTQRQQQQQQPMLKPPPLQHSMMHATTDLGVAGSMKRTRIAIWEAPLTLHQQSQQGHAGPGAVSHCNPMSSTRPFARNMLAPADTFMTDDDFVRMCTGARPTMEASNNRVMRLDDSSCYAPDGSHLVAMPVPEAQAHSLISLPEATLCSPPLCAVGSMQCVPRLTPYQSSMCVGGGLVQQSTSMNLGHALMQSSFSEVPQPSSILDFHESARPQCDLDEFAFTTGGMWTPEITSRMCGMLLRTALLPSPDSRIITEARAPFRIVHVNDTWVDLCQYHPDETKGHTPKMLQGPLTDKVAIREMMDTVVQTHFGRTAVINYKKNGEPFLNMLTVMPLLDDAGNITHFMGVLVDMSC